MSAIFRYPCLRYTCVDKNALKETVKITTSSTTTSSTTTTDRAAAIESPIPEMIIASGELPSDMDALQLLNVMKEKLKDAQR